MIKRTSLSLLAILCYAPSEAQEIPSTMTIGPVKVKVDADARILISKEIYTLSANKKYVEAMLRRMSLYFPIIEKELKEESIPDELKYLCALESGLFPDQISSSNAVGFWQFKEATAIEAGLRVDSQVDERRHIQASTRAMAIYLKRSNLILHNWVSSLLSYRSGLSAVRKMSHIDWAYKKEINITGSADPYIIRFLAYRYYLENEFLKVRHEPVNAYLLEYKNTRGKSIKTIASELGVSVSEIVVNNTWLKSTTIPDDKDYPIYITADVDRYVELKATIDNQKNGRALPSTPNQDLGFPVLVRLTQETNRETDPIYYEINGIKGILAVSGDTPESIANRAGINVNRFLKYNDISLSERIISGEVYYLKKKKSRAEIAYHTVQGYETLWKISQMYGIQLSDLLEKNRFTQVQRLQKGRLLYLRESRPEMQTIEYVQMPEEPVSSPAAPLNTVSYEPKEDPSAKAPKEESSVVSYDVSPAKFTNTVKKGNDYNNDAQQVHTVMPKETFYSIARTYGMTPLKLYELNGLSPTSVLRIGQTLQVAAPQKGGAIQGAENDSPNVGKYLVDKSKVLSTEDLGSYTSSVSSNTLVHTVAPKQNLYRISLLYHVSVADIKKWNGLVDDNVQRGQNLTIYSNELADSDSNYPTVAVANTRIATNVDKIHTVKAGETVYHIAELYNLRVDDIVRMNHIRGFIIHVGQQLIIRR